jgi:hypothetical protein
LTGGTTFRGQPLVLLGVLLAGWFGVRVAVWQSPFPASDGVAHAAQNGTDAPRRTPAAPAPESNETFFPSAPAAPADDLGEWLRGPVPEPLPVRPGWAQLPLLAPVSPPQASAAGAARVQGEAPRESGRPANVGTIVGHNLLMMAGLQGVLPDALVAALQRDPRPPAALARSTAQAEGALAPAGTIPNRQAAAGSRWSADAWVLLRDDSDAPLLLGQGAYGRSQAGGVLRYRLAPGSGHAPQAHLRGSVALSDPGVGQREKEVAVGLSARPIPSVPVRVAAEARVSDTAAGTSVRPSVYAVTELNPVQLPLGARGEVYLQGGYVGGDFATAFVDGQARIERPLGRAGPAEFFAGAAAWGGAQEGASRVDVGPSAGATIGIGRLRARLTADYRLRVAGDSRPASGPALTLYAGF